MSKSSSALLEFPIAFPIKIMGVKHPEFASTVLAVVRQYAPDTAEAHLKMRDSSKGNYVGCTVTVWAESQVQLDNIYRALTAHAMVKVVL